MTFSSCIFQYIFWKGKPFYVYQSNTFHWFMVIGVILTLILDTLSSDRECFILQLVYLFSLKICSYYWHFNVFDKLILRWMTLNLQIHGKAQTLIRHNLYSGPIWVDRCFITSVTKFNCVFVYIYLHWNYKCRMSYTPVFS